MPDTPNDELEEERAWLVRMHDEAEHPDVVEDSADLAEDLIEQATADALLELLREHPPRHEQT